MAPHAQGLGFGGRRATRRIPSRPSSHPGISGEDWARENFDMQRVMLLTALGVALGAPPFAAEQPVPTKALIVKNPSSGARRVLWKVVERSSAATVVGDPTVDGASLH